jgi:MFS superfamily sulfate permease-like transporter
MTVTFSVTLFISVEVGIMAGIGISILLLIKNITKSHLTIFGNIPGTTRYKDTEKYPQAVKYTVSFLHTTINQQDILIVGINDALYFSNVSVFVHAYRL